MHYKQGIFVDPPSGSGARTIAVHNTLACNKIQRNDVRTPHAPHPPSDMCAGKMPLSYQRNIVIYAVFYKIFDSLSYLRGKLDFIENDDWFPLFQLDTVFKLQAHENTVTDGNVIEQITDFTNLKILINHRNTRNYFALCNSMENSKTGP